VFYLTIVIFGDLRFIKILYQILPKNTKKITKKHKKYKKSGPGRIQ